MSDTYNLERALEALAEPNAKRYRDTFGPAIYQVEPTWATAILCQRCQYVAIIPRLPRRPIFTHECSSCGAVIRLAPPLEVLGAAPQQSVLPSASVSRQRPS